MSTLASSTTTAHDHGAKASSDIAPGEIAVGVVVGRASEYFDFFVYGIASALVFPAVFFPFLDRLHGTLAAFAVFALAFVARPVGTIVFMWIQSRWGLATKLITALMLLGTATAGIAFVPGYGTLGVVAIVLLACFRVLQGVALGGSWDGLPSLLALHAPKDRRGWYAMLGQLGAPVGFIVAAGVFAFLYASLSEDDLLAWGWRYPFFVAFALNVVALFARLRLVVADEYMSRMSELELQPTPVAELVREKGRHVVIGAFAALASYALFHIVTIFPLSYLALFAPEQSVVGFLLLQVFGQAIVEMLAHLFRPLQTRTESLRPWFVTLAWGLVGGFVGALSLALFPRHFVHTPELRVLKAFLRDKLYHHFQVLRMTDKARRIIQDLFGAFMNDPRLLPPQYQAMARADKARAIADYIAGMTDRYAMREHRRLFAVGEIY
jgi:MFS family permease